MLIGMIVLELTSKVIIILNHGNLIVTNTIQDNAEVNKNSMSQRGNTNALLNRN